MTSIRQGSWSGTGTEHPTRTTQIREYEISINKIIEERKKKNMMIVQTRTRPDQTNMGTREGPRTGDKKSLTKCQFSIFTGGPYARCSSFSSLSGDHQIRAHGLITSCSDDTTVFRIKEWATGLPVALRGDGARLAGLSRIALIDHDAQKILLVWGGLANYCYRLQSSNTTETSRGWWIIYSKEPGWGLEHRVTVALCMPKNCSGELSDADVIDSWGIWQVAPEFRDIGSISQAQSQKDSNEDFRWLWFALQENSHICCSPYVSSNNLLLLGGCHYISTGPYLVLSLCTMSHRHKSNIQNTRKGKWESQSTGSMKSKKQPNNRRVLFYVVQYVYLTHSPIANPKKKIKKKKKRRKVSENKA